MNNKKFKKLLRDPKLFFQDMYIKRSMQIKKKLPLKYEGSNQFTIVSAVYNVEKYLNDYFTSITNQSLNFKKHIQIILVDDGSTDHSAEIIKKWQAKFPKNIHYFYKENGGQASARNLGLEYVQTEWVTFIDPDDFLSPDYFYKTDKFIQENKNLSIIGCPLVLYFEDTQITKDTHPLKYRFSKGDVIFPLSNLEDHLQLSASTAFFKVQNIRQHQIVFDAEMKPSFEDAKFVTDYILSCESKSNAGFISGISYFYRKRSDCTSTLDGAWKNPLLFSRVIEKGCIEILKTAKRNFGVIPEHIQRIALYHIIWYFGRIVNNPASLSHLSEEQKEQFVTLLYEMFEYIDTETILRFNLAGTWWFQKVALLGLFKHKKPSSQIAYVEDYDLKKNQILIKYFSNFPVLECWISGDTEIFPMYRKEVPYDFIGRLYTKEYRTWVQCDTNGTTLKLLLDGKIAKLTFQGKQFEKLPISEVRNYFRQKSTVQSNVWILMDRDNQADDNAEHLYRYISNNYPEQEIYFALNHSSSDWERLSSEGFNLLEFGSRSFEHQLRRCAKIISSHIDGYITNYFKDNSLADKDYVFLQHGITKDDLSSWLNTKKISLFVTATKDEYRSIAADDTYYKFGAKEVKLTGFPRYDRLLNGNNTQSRQILIMPTWRSSIAGAYIQGTERVRNPEFMNTDYAKHWHGFMNHPSLAQIHQHGYEIVFAPHPNIQEYMDEFTVPKFVKIYSYTEGNIQKLFQNTSILITDYSSVAFDVAYLNKAILYYQFDYDEVFSGSHTYKKGYFDYQRDGFGDVAHTQEELLKHLRTLIRNKGRLSEIYQNRINHTFAFRDNGNCERVYRAIIALDQPEMVDNLPILKKMIDHAEDHQAWALAARRIQTLIETGRLNQVQLSDYQHRYFNALFEDKQFNKLQGLLLDYPEESGYWQAKIELQIGNAIKGAEFFAGHDTVGTQEDLLTALLLAALNQASRSSEKLSARLDKDLAEQYRPLLAVADKLSEQNYFVALALLKTCTDKMNMADKSRLKPELLASYICMKLGNLQGAHQYLVAFEKHTQNDPGCRIAIAHLARLRGDSEKMFAQLNRAFEENLLQVPEDLAVDYLKKMYESGNTEGAAYLLAQFRQKYPENQDIALYEAN